MNYLLMVGLVAVMATVTYLIRMIPLSLLRKKIKSQFIKSMLYYMPYTVLSAMTFPAILYSTGNIYTALVGTAVALILSLLKLSLIIVSICAVVAALIVGLIIL